MRKQFVDTVMALMEEDPRLVLLLGDIGVYGFRKAFESFPDRVYNIGILEQSTVSLASGLSMEGFVPVIHTIAPFLVERSLEQLKNDFCYQSLGGNFVSAGASYDYAALGCTHHCPGDAGILKTLPGMEIMIPGTGKEFAALFRQAYANDHPTYFRLSEKENDNSYEVQLGKANVVKTGSKAVVVAAGPSLGPVLEACSGIDVTILYYTTISPFDADTLNNICTNLGAAAKEQRRPDEPAPTHMPLKILLCEPYYSGVLVPDIVRALAPRPVSIQCFGVPHEFMRNYGTAQEHDQLAGLTPDNIRNKLECMINEQAG